MPSSSRTTPAADRTPPPPALPARIALATHYYATGPAFDLEAYLAPRVARLLFVAHPLYAGGGDSYQRSYGDGRLIDSARRPGGRPAVRFAGDVARTIAWVRAAGRFDVFIAGDNLLALAGLWLRRRGRVRRVILYTMDYVERRFANPAVNRAYHAIDRLAAHRADAVWNVSEAIGAARRTRDRDGAVAPTIVVPLGANYDRIPRREPQAPVEPTIAFLGHVLERQGLQLVIQALPLVRREVPQASFLVLGDGPHLAALKRQALQARLGGAVEFAGFVEDHRMVEERLCACALAVAPYVPDPSNSSRFADPGKIKTYLACGLPVLVTDVPAVARLVERRGAGRVVPYDAAALAAAVIGYLKDPPALARARAAAAALGAEFSWDRIFAQAFRESAPYLA